MSESSTMSGATHRRDTTPRADGAPEADGVHASDASATALRQSAWTTKQKVLRVVWWTLGRAVWIVAPGQRSRMIRLFGGRVGEGCVFDRSVEIAIPWNLRIGDGVRIGPRALLYSLGVITIGSGSVLDRRAHLCAGTHDHADPNFRLLRPPIELGERCFVGFDAYVGPDVTLGDGCTVHARASVYRSYPAGTELCGNPARVIGHPSALDVTVRSDGGAA